MQRPEPDEPEESRSRPSSRRSSVSLPRSLKKDKKSPLHTPPISSHSTPKKTPRPSLDFMVTGKQILKRIDRADSLPGSCRRPSSDSATMSNPRARKISERAESQASRKNSLEEDLSLDLSQVSDFEDSKCDKLPLATSTPNPSSEVGYKHSSEIGYKPSSEVGYKPTSTPRSGQKPRSASLQHIQQRVERRTATQQSMDSSSRRSQQSVDVSSRKSQYSVDVSSRRSHQSVDVSAKPSRDSTFSYSRDSLYKTSSSASTHRYGTDYSSVSPEYSQSSAEPSPHADPSPLLSSCCSQSWAERTVEGGGGEWSRFWANYKHALPRAPLGYDQCPTPYRQDSNQTDFDWSARSRSPDSIQHISSILQREGLRLTPRDTQHVIRCAHLLGSVLSRAIDRQKTTDDPHLEDKKRTLTLDLKETSAAKTSETVMTQTDISLPNTKSAPLIFENILRQLSKNSIDDPDVPVHEKLGGENGTQNDS